VSDILEVVEPHVYLALLKVFQLFLKGFNLIIFLMDQLLVLAGLEGLVGERVLLFILIDLVSLPFLDREVAGVCLQSGKELIYYFPELIDFIK